MALAFSSLFGESKQALAQPRFVPMSVAELAALGWENYDVLLISGDAYVDHPSFGLVLLARLLIAHGFRTALIAQPRWDRLDDVLRLGRPRLFCGVGAGAVDSLVANYTAFRQKRLEDAYSPGGVLGLRPNRATIVYVNLVRQAFPGLPVICGGIEASTRRVTHYDFWSNALRRPILFDAKADLLVYGMGERALVDLARALDRDPTARLWGIPGTAWISRLGLDGPSDVPSDYLSEKPMVLPSHEQILTEKRELLNLTLALERQVHQAKTWAYEVVGSRALVLAKPAKPLTSEEMDALYALPFTRKAHPCYQKPIPAALMLKTSLTSHRGCGGGCSFCSLALHQGRTISSRSAKSLLAEAKDLVKLYPRSRRQEGLAISDVGGPTANMWMGKCTARPEHNCQRVSCCYPKPCPFFHTPQAEHISLLRQIKKVQGVRSVRVASGIRPDLALKDQRSLLTYIREFTGGQLKLAPEHSEARVLKLMRKPPLEVFERFLAIFQEESHKLGRKQYIVPYLMSAFPGCNDEDMKKLVAWLKKRHWSPKQTQCFIPTPGTVATAMFYCGENEEGEKIAVARSDGERLKQHRLLVGPGGARFRKAKQEK